MARGRRGFFVQNNGCLTQIREGNEKDGGFVKIEVRILRKSLNLNKQMRFDANWM